MKELEKSFIGKGEVRGFEFTQIKKNEKAFIYRVDTGDSTHYEVFKRKINRMYNCESYPRSKSFGLWAWSKDSLKKANELFEELSAEV